MRAPLRLTSCSYCEVNYAGQSAAALDVFFGTFAEKFTEPPPPKPRADAKATLVGLPALQDTAYLGLSAACVATWWWTAVHGDLAGTWTGLGVSAVAGFGPVLLACGFTAVQGGMAALRHAFDAPPAHTVLHVVAGSLLTALPVTLIGFKAL